MSYTYDDDDDPNSILIVEYMADTTNDKRVIKFLKSKKCTAEIVNYIDDDGWTSLILAARLARFEVMQVMINKGAKVNYVDSDHSYNALMHLISNATYYDAKGEANFLACAKLLIDAGTDLNFKDRFSAFTMACRSESSLLPLLLAQNVDIDWKDEQGNTGLDYLIKDKNEEGIAMVQAYQLHGKLSTELSEKVSTPQRKI